MVDHTLSFGLDTELTINYQIHQLTKMFPSLFTRVCVLCVSGGFGGRIPTHKHIFHSCKQCSDVAVAISRPQAPTEECEVTLNETLYTFTNHYLRLLRVNFGRPLHLAPKLKGGDVVPPIYYLQRATEGEARGEAHCAHKRLRPSE